MGIFCPFRGLLAVVARRDYPHGAQRRQDGFGERGDSTLNYYPPQQVGGQGPRGVYLSEGDYGHWTMAAAPGQPRPKGPTEKLPAPPPGTTERVPYLYPPGSVQAFFGRHALVFGLVLSVLVFVAFQLIPVFVPFGGLEGEIAIRLMICLVLVCLFHLMGMAGEIRLTTVGLRTALVVGIYELLLALFLALFRGGFMAASPSSYVHELLTPSGFISAVEGLVFCLLIGMFEEMLTRGMFLSGLQSRLGKSTRGLHVAVYIAAVFFGLLHVLDVVALLAMGEIHMSGLVAMQMLMKVVQTGVLGVLLGAVTIRTHSIWGAVVIHALDDYILMLAGFLTGQGFVIPTGGGFPLWPLAEAGTTYVSSSPEEAVALIQSYTIISLMSIPLLVISAKLISAARIPDTGAMCEEYVAHEIEEYDKRESLVLMRPLMPFVTRWQAPTPQPMAVPYQMTQMPYWAAPQASSPSVSQVAWQTMPQPVWGQSQQVPTQLQPMPQQAYASPQQQASPQTQYPQQYPQQQPQQYSQQQSQRQYPPQQQPTCQQPPQQGQPPKWRQ